MSSIPLIVVTGYMILAAIQAALWGRQIVTRNASPADIGWSVGMFVLVGWFALNIQGYWLREIILLILVGIWSFRLSSYLITRMIRENEEDSRYARLRKKWGKNAIQNFFIIYQLQPIFNVILAIPILIMLQNPAESIGVFEIIGIVGWIIALIGESVADAQLNRFRSNPDNKGKICQEGLWAYSRHPNFFFEWCIWVSYFVMALSSPNGWLAIVSPAFMFFLLMKVTGIPIMEEHAIKNKGEAFKEYMRTTSFFIPLPRRA